jgi:CubicO group peptidase (beta-lactamase class C family)
MRNSFSRRSFLGGASATTAMALLGRPAIAATADADAAAAQFDADRASIRAGMAESGIGAAAVCLIDGGRVAWIEGFGRTAGSGGEPVGPETLFSIQSTTKNFTAVAVLLAVQEGLLALDTPISRYLPGFTVRSRFEHAPVERMTLRLLLANRAGFTHEAPVGNNYEPASPGFEAHVRSISGTWLRFPVGDRYRYSNLGFDLAGYILEQKTGIAYAEWLRRKLFEPLGMTRSTADSVVYTQVANRALGSHKGYDEVPVVTPLLASGGVYTSARDMAAYALFHLSGGKAGERQLLDRALWEEMHGFAYGGDYSLGVMRSELRHGSTPLRLLHHRGGGFGFGCDFVYCPRAGIAWAALFNRPALAGYRFGNRPVERLLTERFGARKPRLQADALAPIAPLPAQVRALVGSYIGRNVRARISDAGGQLQLEKEGAAAPLPLRMTSPEDLFTVDADGNVTTYRLHPATDALPAHLECSDGEASLDRNDGPGDPAGPDRKEWERYVGQYRVEQWGRPAMDVTVERRNGYLCIDGIRLVVETEPGLFFTCDGEAVDFRSPTPTWRNLLLRKA